MVLPTIDILTVHVDGGDAKISTGLGWGLDPAPAIFWTINLVCGHPSLVVLYALTDQTAEVLVVWVTWPIFAVQSLLKVTAGSAGYRCCQWMEIKVWTQKCTDRSSTSARNSAARANSFCLLGWTAAAMVTLCKEGNVVDTEVR